MSAPRSCHPTLNQAKTGAWGRCHSVPSARLCRFLRPGNDGLVASDGAVPRNGRALPEVRILGAQRSDSARLEGEFLRQKICLRAKRRYRSQSKKRKQLVLSTRLTASFVVPRGRKRTHS